MQALITADQCLWPAVLLSKHSVKVCHAVLSGKACKSYVGHIASGSAGLLPLWRRVLSALNQQKPLSSAGVCEFCMKGDVCLSECERIVWKA